TYMLLIPYCFYSFFFFFNHSPPPDISTFSLHDALPISSLLVRLVVLYHFNYSGYRWRLLRDGRRWRSPSFSIASWPAITGVVEKIGRAVQQECRDRTRMPASACKKKNKKHSIAHLRCAI